MRSMQNEFYKEAGKRIMEVRIANNISRETLAENANISSKFLYEIEAGKKGFSAYTLERLTKALSVKSDFIMMGIEQNYSIEEIYSTIELFDKRELETLKKLLEAVYELVQIKVK